MARQYTYRIFNGKKYRWRDLTRTKRMADMVAKDYRKGGKSVRITKTPHGNYEVWVR